MSDGTDNSDQDPQARLEEHGLRIDAPWDSLDEATLLTLANAMDAAVKQRKTDMQAGLEQAAKMLPGPILRRIRKNWEAK